MRYDKAQNFDGNVSPRVSLVYSGESRRHNFERHFKRALEIHLPRSIHWF
jgi:hypothetical protein